MYEEDATHASHRETDDVRTKIRRASQVTITIDTATNLANLPPFLTLIQHKHTSEMRIITTGSPPI